MGNCSVEKSAVKSGESVMENDHVSVFICRLPKPSSMTTRIYKHSASPSLVIWLMSRVVFCLSLNCSTADG